jgi:predicted dehydrogenase
MNKLYYPDGSKLGWHTPISGEKIKVVSGDPIERELRHFCKVVSGEEPPRISGEEGKRTLEVILAIKESAETGQPISL